MKNRRFWILLVVGNTLMEFAQAQFPIVVQPTDREIIQHILSQNDSLIGRTLPQRLVAVGKMLLEKPYQAKTLEMGTNEKLVVNLRAFDCTTFLETAMALAHLIPQKNREFGNYCQQLIQIRYRNGRSDIYAARLHYLTDWIEEKMKHNKLEDITQQLGGQSYDKALNFMSTHPQAYEQLADKRNLTEMQAVERELNTRKRFYIPKADVSKIEAQLQEGDIIAMTTGVKGLDVVHVGMAVLKGGRIHLLHASSDQKKVAISAFPLPQYLAKNTAQTGIIVARLKP